MNVSIWPSLLALFFVLVLIPLSLWLIRSVRQLQPAQKGPLVVLHRNVVGPREQLAIVRAGNKTLLVGITSQSIQTLCELSEDALSGLEPAAALADEGSAPALTFQSILKRMRKS